jgi:mannose-6-phosphate isomerase-like protein (cupin superfamily)
VREDRLRMGSSPSSRVIQGGSTFTVPPTAIHRVLHAGERPAVTIHAYSPPLTRTGAYRIGPGGELERESHSFEEELRAELALAS